MERLSLLMKKNFLGEIKTLKVILTFISFYEQVNVVLFITLVIIDLTHSNYLIIYS